VSARPTAPAAAAVRRRSAAAVPSRWTPLLSPLLLALCSAAATSPTESGVGGDAARGATPPDAPPPPPPPDFFSSDGGVTSLPPSLSPLLPLPLRPPSLAAVVLSPLLGRIRGRSTPPTPLGASGAPDFRITDGHRGLFDAPSGCPGRVGEGRAAPAVLLLSTLRLLVLLGVRLRAGGVRLAASDFAASAPG
jgi:hypothetical protein